MNRYVLHFLMISLILFISYSFSLASPQITIINPGQNEVIEDQSIFYIEGQIEDRYGLKSIDILINNRKLSDFEERGIKLQGSLIKQMNDLKGIDLVPLKMRIPVQALSSGNNILQIRANNLKGERVNYERTFQFSPPKVNVYVIIIGIDNYKDKIIPSLRYAEKDARAIRDYYKTFLKVADENIFLLTGERATTENIKKVLGVDIRRKASKTDQVIIYFAGHGAPEPEVKSSNADGIEKYLLTYNTSMDALYATAIPMREIEYILDRLTSERLVLILDVCFSGQSGRSVRAKGMTTRSIVLSDFYNRMASGKGKVIMAASGPNEASQENDRLGHGVYTYYLLEALSGKADYDKDGIVTVMEAQQYLEKKVALETLNSQKPELYGSMSSIALGKSSVSDIALDLPIEGIKKGRVIIETQPEDAWIKIDGQDKGNGPVLNTVMVPGKHKVTVGKGGYLTQNRDINMTESTVMPLKFSLFEQHNSAPPP